MVAGLAFLTLLTDGDQVGLPYVAHDERYKIADEYVEILYR